MCNRYVGLCRECVPVQVVVKVEQTVPWGSLTRHVTCMGDGRGAPRGLKFELNSSRHSTYDATSSPGDIDFVPETLS